MKQYNISKAARILNVSSGLIRHYESIGLIAPIREENGYRHFDIKDIDMLLGIKRFRNMGFSLEKMDLLIHNGDYEQVKENFSNRLKELEEELAWKQMLLETIREVNNEIIDLEKSDNVYTEKMSPEVLRITSRINDTFFLQNINADTLKWVDKMPIVSISPMFSLDAIINGEKEVNFGFVVPFKLAEKLGLSGTKGAEYYPSVPCITTVIHSYGEERIHSGKLVDALDFIKENNYEPAGDPWGITIGNYNENGQHKRFHRIFIPVSKK